MTKTEEKILEVFEKLSKKTEDRLSLEKDVKNLQEEEKILKEELKILIPADSTKGGIFHNVTRKPSVSYSKLYDALLKEVIPKTKASMAEDLKESFTSFSETHTFKRI